MRRKILDEQYNQADPKNIGENLFSLRNLNHYSMQTLADLVFMAKTSIFMYEHGYRKPPKDALQILADFYNTPIEDFYLDPTEFNLEIIKAYTE